MIRAWKKSKRNKLYIFNNCSTKKAFSRVIYKFDNSITSLSMYLSSVAVIPTKTEGALLDA